MVKEIIKNVEILSQRSERATKEDFHIIKDLIDTAEHHKERCCGLAAIQLGIPKRIIVVLIDYNFVPMINPVITQKSNNKYKVEEGCMSLDGKKEVTRNYNVTVMYNNQYNKTVKLQCNTSVSQIVQHEIDHCNGILI